jgi:hypothetical protein
VTGQADSGIRWTTTGCVALLALIAGAASYLHMHRLVASHGQPGWVASLTPLSVDGMIVAASATLLAESRAGRRGGALPWALLVCSAFAVILAQLDLPEPRRPPGLVLISRGRSTVRCRGFDLNNLVAITTSVAPAVTPHHPTG